MKSPYQFAIDNCAQYINDTKHLKMSSDPEVIPLNAFELSAVLSVAFVKAKEDVLLDIINAGSKF